MNKKLALALCTSAVLAATATGCGDDTDERIQSWAQEVCNEVGPQVEKIQNANNTIAEAGGEDTAPAEVQEADSQAFQSLSEAYGALADTVDEAGDPPVEDGAELRENAVAELNDISDAYSGLKERIDGLDTDDQSAFADGLNGIVEELNQLGQSSQNALSELQSGELGQAMSEQEGCQSPAPGGDASPDA
ncbi:MULTISPECIES: small secreted protein [Streptomyces]|uniref:small secreted protein n=1 Tax=Streptomyces TaxID=1883 RepID=UPI0022492587|nr:small secreted protein [Streptomyces sp. JHD 1]MCX2970543.1 small secreted protein [Streptomyces sp. JHD 1]